MTPKRALVTAALALALAGAGTGGVGAEEMPDPLAAAYFTFDEPVTEPRTEDAIVHADEFEAQMRGDVEVARLDATDPRASGRLTTVSNVNQLEVTGGGVAIGNARLQLVNDGGTWTGTSQGIHFVTDDGGATTVAVLTGEDGYERLTLVLYEYADDDAQTRRGLIIPSDQLPPMPQPGELPTE